METKICAQCGQEKPIEDFSKSYKNLCKACVAENERKKRNGRTVCYGRGLEVFIPEDATFIPPMRLQIAIAAMQGMLSNRVFVKAFHRELSPTLESIEAADLYRVFARNAVLMADSLINELKNQKNENNQ